MAEANYAHSFFDFAFLLASPDQQIGDISRIIQDSAHYLCGEHRYEFAIHPPAEETPSAPISRVCAPVHHLIAVIIPSSKIPVTGRVFKESIKVRTPKSPPSADDPPLNLATSNVFAYGPWIQPEHFRCLAKGEEVLSNRFRRCLCLVPHGRPLFVMKLDTNGFLIGAFLVRSTAALRLHPRLLPLSHHQACGEASHTHRRTRLGLTNLRC